MRTKAEFQVPRKKVPRMRYEAEFQDVPKEEVYETVQSKIVRILQRR